MIHTQFSGRFPAKAALFAFGLLALLACGRQPALPEGSTRGIGVYPGNPAEYTGPALVPAGEEYRNLALHRVARASSAYDYNLTAQLATDGIPAVGEPLLLDVSVNGKPLAKRDREKPFDGNGWTSVSIPGGPDASLTLILKGGKVEADRLCIRGLAQPMNGDYSARPQPCSVVVEVSSDGEHWQPVAERSDKQFVLWHVVYKEGVNAYNFDWEFPLSGGPFAALRIRFDGPGVETWTLQQADLSLDGKAVSLLPSARFCSVWMSEDVENEWICVDLGADARFDALHLQWLERPEGGVVESSSDGVHWKQLKALPPVGPLEESLELRGRGRYVRLAALVTSPGSRIALGEMEVWGRGGVVPVAQEAGIPGQAGNDAEGTGDEGIKRMVLRGGAWRLQRASEVAEAGETLSAVGFEPEGWLPATVPGTVLTSYVNAGAVPDARYDDEQLQVSESYFLDDFWYRDEFELPAAWEGQETLLHFDGINWKAEVWVNGSRAGRIDGAFTRAGFDVTALLKPGRNALAVKIFKNDHPGIVKEQDRISADLNGGILGADNPTMHATIGWDWIPTVRGRNIGIWNDVWLSAHAGGVSIDDVFVDTDLPLPATDYAELRPVVTLTNHGAEARQAEIRLSYGGLVVSGGALLAAGETRDVALPAARLEHPELWWPAGYGEPQLYEVETSVSVDGAVSDRKKQFSGVREMSYTMEGGVLDFYVNGRRLIGNGGNWGFPEINLNYRSREYDTAVAYHADMHFTMIRNWVGQTGDEEFWEACDRHGVMVWQDFWLANPADGPEPDDEAMFLQNAEDFLRKIRHHPCLALYCGRNEGNPPAALDAGLSALVARLHPGLHYIPHSATGPVSGNGPYRALPVEEYFTLERGRDRFHSERGMPNVPVAESLERMLREEHRWPQNDVWGMHDYALESAQSAATFNAMVEKAFGQPESLEQFAAWAQWIDYEGYRAMYESRSAERKGLLIWMSHSCWPSMVWQTYDYYFAPTAAYFGAKKGSAPVRIQWNPASGRVEVVNNNAGELAGLTAQAVVAGLDGSVLSEQRAELDAPEDTTTPLSFEIPGQAGGDGPSSAGSGETFFLRLRLLRGDTELADNFYVLNPSDPGNLQALNQLPAEKVDLRTEWTREGDHWLGTAMLENRSRTPALMLRLNLVGAHDGEQILPVFYEDNWISLLPGESKRIRVRCAVADTRGERPELHLHPFPLPAAGRKSPQGKTTYVETVRVEADDSQEDIIRKAANLVPSPRQAAALENGFIAFLHFGPNTFTRREWGTGFEDPAVFDLKELHTDNWCRQMKEAGMKMAILTVKHHDGFCLWQTRYTTHGIMSTGYRDGQGDILRELAESCRKYGLKLGIYLSPADLYQIESPDGLYGNLSAKTPRTIPRPVEGRPFDDKRSFTFTVDDYNEYFLNQLFELLTEYGRISEVWFDGAHPKRKGGQTYDYTAWRELIRTLAPDATVFGREDIRWCGNEGGSTRDAEFNVVTFREDPAVMTEFEDMYGELGTRKVYAAQDRPFYLHYEPCETNTSIRAGWFFSDDDTQEVRTADDVFDIYERAVGGNSIFLLNIPPNREGRFSERDAAVLQEVGKRIRETYGEGCNLLAGAKGPRKVLDGRDGTFVPADGLVIKLRKPVTLNRIVLREPVRTVGERVEACAVDARIDGQWKEVATGTNIGFRRILRFADVTTDALRIRITATRDEALLSGVEAYRYRTRPPAIEAVQAPDGTVTLKPAFPAMHWWSFRHNDASDLYAGCTILYATQPGAELQPYGGPFHLENGELRAVAELNGDRGPELVRHFGWAKQDWKVLDCSSEYPGQWARQAIDGRNDTGWQSRDGAQQYLSIDLGEERELRGFAYTPHANTKESMIEQGIFRISADGRRWKDAESFTFGNLLNDPTRRVHTFGKPLRTRYVQIRSTAIAGGGNAAGMAELDLF